MPETIFWIILLLPLTAFALAGLSAMNQHLPRQIPEWDPHYPRSWKPIADLFCGPRLASTPLIIALLVAFVLSLIAMIDLIGDRGLPMGFAPHTLFEAGPLKRRAGRGDRRTLRRHAGRRHLRLAAGPDLLDRLSRR